MAKTKGTLEWAIKNVNFSKGCENDCGYCYAKAMAKRFGWKKELWNQMINKEEMIHKKFKKYDGWIMIPSSHDITEYNLELACNIFYNLLHSGNKILIVTKPRLPVIAEILYRFQDDYADRMQFRFTITTANDNMRQHWEKNASSIRERMQCLYLAYKAGFRTSVSIEPFLDNTVLRLVRYVYRYVTDEIWIGPMNMTHVPKELREETSQDSYYTVENLRYIKNEIEDCRFDKVRFKDHFLNKIKEAESTD